MPLAVVPTASNRRATPGKRASKASTLSGSTPSSSATSVAAAAFSRLWSPGCGMSITTLLPSTRSTPVARRGPAPVAPQRRSTPGRTPHRGARASRAGGGAGGAGGGDAGGGGWGAGAGGGAGPPRRSHLGCVGLDRRRIDEAVDRSRDGGPVVWRELDSQQSEPRGDVLVLPLVERAVGALDVVTARPHQGGERVHPGAGDAGEVISHRDPPLSRLAELRRSACLLGFFFSEARF